jgi:hypothetical protein
LGAGFGRFSDEREGSLEVVEGYGEVESVVGICRDRQSKLLEI